MSNATLAAGTTVEFYDGAIWRPISEPKSIGDLGEDGSFVDVTHLSSPNQTREYIAGMRDTSELTVTHAFVPADADDEAFRARATSKLSTNMRVTLPTTPARVATFTLVLGGWKLTSPAPDAPLEAAVSGRISGPVTWS